MNKLWIFAVLSLGVSIPAHAQRSMSGSTGPSGSSYINGGVAGSGGSGGGTGAPVGGGGSVMFHTLAPVPSAQFMMSDVSGTPTDFTPSSWTQFEAGLARGRAELAAQQKTLGEVAAENRRAEKAKAKFTLTQDAEGKAVIQRQQ